MERVTRQIVDHGWHGWAVRWQVPLALALAEEGRGDEALDWLRAAVRLAAPEHYVRDFVDAGPALQPLLRDLMRSRDPVDRDFIRGVLDDHAEGEASTALVETLTDRQMDVLRELASGRSNREIADALYLAEGTVKAHVHQITAKLLARNRTEAVARARALGLLG
jgi:LuxR family maltose regulon positive regulatory protein